jgi:hypothetical protein
MTLEQFITSCKLVIGDRSLSSVDVLETVEDCLEEEFDGNDNLEEKLEEFKKHYHNWIEYHSRQSY